MLTNYLNKQVVVEEKLYHGPSSMYSRGLGRSLSGGVTNLEEGILTAINDDFIELDNKQLVSRKYIYRIMLK